LNNGALANTSRISKLAIKYDAPLARENNSCFAGFAGWVEAYGLTWQPR
jgi:hypothetical protein